jgi:Spy/CpxP family protein refolding chaperone
VPVFSLKQREKSKGKTMNKRWIPLLAIALLVAAMASAQPMTGAPPQRGGRMAAMLVAVLQPTPDQLTTWKQLREAQATAMKPLVQNARDLRGQLDTAMKATAPDPATVGKLTLELRTARQAIRALADDSKAKFVATLTPDQKTKFEALQAAGKAFRRPHAMGGMGLR